jgi:hypothetical protein
MHAAVTTPPMTHVGQATMVPTAMPATAPTMKPGKPAVKPTPTAVKRTGETPSTMPTAAPTSASAFAAPGDCRSVRDEAKRANRNACCQNTYRSLLHGKSPLEVLKPLVWRRAHGSRLIQSLATAAE